MITLQTTGRNFELDPKILKYLDQKIGSLEKYLPRPARPATGVVVLEIDKSGREDNQCVCEISVDVKGEKMHAREATMNMYAAIDICEQKIKIQALKYKSKHEPAKNRGRRMLAKLWTQESSVTTDREEAK